MKEKAKAKEILQKIIPFLGIILMIIIFQVGGEGKLLTKGNINSILNQTVYIAIMAFGAIFVYSHGGMDLSYGGVIGFSVLVAILVANTGVPAGVVFITNILAALVWFVLNGVVSVYLQVSPFITSLCIMYMCRGILNTVCASQKYSIPVELFEFDNQKFKLGMLLGVFIICYILFEKTAIGKDNKANKLITYAASFGNTTVEKLEKYNKKAEISELLNKFDKISARDSNTGKIVEEISNQKVVYNLDPVLAYDYMNKCDEIPDIDVNEKYIIVYAYSNRISTDESKYIKKFAKKNNLKVYSIGGAQKCADKFIDCSPFEVLGYFKKAEMVITDTFHGSIFSIIAKRNFVTLVRRSVGNAYGNEEKLTDLLERLKLTDRITYNIENINSILDKKIDYEKVEKILKSQRNISKKYLEENL